MFTKTRIRGIGYALIILFLFAGCAGLRLSNNEQYYKALGIWYDCGMQFKRYYGIATPEMQEQWDEEFRPLLITAKDALNIWYVHLYDGEPVNDDIMAWKEAKDDLLFYIATQMKGRETL